MDIRVSNLVEFPHLKIFNKKNENSFMYFLKQQSIRQDKQFDNDCYI